MKKFDIHTHFGPVTSEETVEQLYEKLMLDIDNSGIDKFVILVAERFGNNDWRKQIDDALWFKAQQPKRVYVFGAIDFDRHNKDDSAYAEQLLAELDGLFERSCDGLKMLIGKPDSRKALGRALDDSVFTPLFNRLEETQFPIVWHIADPVEFWDSCPVPAPLWGSSQNWCYNNSYPSYKSIKDEAENVFIRHPNLNLVLPHFYFMSGDLKKAAEFLDKHPNINIDTAPGVEMCHNCSEKIDEAREFFTKYDSRILFGTDSGMGSHTTSLGRSKMIQDWLETGKEIIVPTDDIYMMPDVKDRFNGLALPAESLQRIYSENFIRVVR
jgi:predicted TIM-barrel fold metal-dependent hydrolase